MQITSLLFVVSVHSCLLLGNLESIAIYTFLTQWTSPFGYSTLSGIRACMSEVIFI